MGCAQQDHHVMGCVDVCTRRTILEASGPFRAGNVVISQLRLSNQGSGVHVVAAIAVSLVVSRHDSFCFFSGTSLEALHGVVF